METSPPAPTHSPVGNDTSKHGDGAQSEAAHCEDLSLRMKPSEGGRVVELPLESSLISSPKSGNFNDNAGERTAVVPKKRKERGKNWEEKDTDELLRAFGNTEKVRTRIEKGTDTGSRWDAIAKVVPGRTSDECRWRMDTLKKACSTIEEYCENNGKEFNRLNAMDFRKMKVSTRLTEAWFNQIRDSWLKKKVESMNGSGSSSKISHFASASSTSGLQPLVLSDGIDQGKPALVVPPASVELPVADPIQQASMPAPELCYDFLEDLDEASSLTLN